MGHEIKRYRYDPGSCLHCLESEDECQCETGYVPVVRMVEVID